MTVEERLKLIIGDLVISRCALETRIEQMDAELKMLRPEPKEKLPESEVNENMFKQAAE